MSDVTGPEIDRGPDPERAVGDAAPADRETTDAASLATLHAANDVDDTSSAGEPPPPEV